jgi:hypothetical protein
MGSKAKTSLLYVLKLFPQPLRHRKLLSGATRWPKTLGLSKDMRLTKYPQITYYWTSLLILGPSYLVGNLTNSKVAETKALEPLKS